MKRKKVLFVVLVLTCACVWAGCNVGTPEVDSGAESSSDVVADAGLESTEPSDTQIGQEETTGMGLKIAEIDYYNENGLVETNYMSFILNTPEDANRIVSVVDFGADLSGLADGGFKHVVDAYGKVCYYGVGTDLRVLYAGCTNYSQPRYYWMGDVEKTESSSLYLLPIHYTGELISAADWYNMIPKEEIENSEFLESQITTMFEGNTGEKSVVLLEDLDDLSSVTNTYGESINLEDTVFYNDAVAELVADRCGLNILKKETLIFLDRAIIKYEGWVLDNEAYITITLRYGDADYGIDINSIRSEYNNVSFGYVDPNGVTYEYYSDEEDGKIYIFRNEEYVAELDVDISFTAEANPAWKEATNIDYMSTIFGIK